MVTPTNHVVAGPDLHCAGRWAPGTSGIFARSSSRNFLACINNQNFLRGATEQNTHQRQEIIFARAYEALTASVTSFLLAKLLGSIARYNLSKKTSHFLRQLNEDFEALFKRARNLFWFGN